MPLEVRTDMGCHGNSVCNLCVSPLSPVGASISQSDTSELKFLYEGHEDFSVIPSYAVIPAQVPHFLSFPPLFFSFLPSFEHPHFEHTSPPFAHFFLSPSNSTRGVSLPLTL